MFSKFIKKPATKTVAEVIKEKCSTKPEAVTPTTATKVETKHTNAEAAMKQIREALSKTANTNEQVATASQAAEQRIAATEKRIAASKVNNTDEDFQNRFVDKQLLALEKRHAEELNAFKNTWGNRKQAPKAKDNFTMWHLATNEYMIGWSKDDGAILLSTRKHMRESVFTIKSHEQVMVSSDNTELVKGMKGFDQVAKLGGAEYQQRRLSLDEVKQILAVKPKWDTLLSAYAVNIVHMVPELIDIQKRYDVTKATVLF